MLTKLEIQELLESREGRSLDFKEGQYAFSGADDITKSELLKDILAFANTARMHDAHILIGVREVKDGTSAAVGVSEHLDDASLQQFINSKTNRKIIFAYEPTPYEGVSLGIICIDKNQARPLWATKRYGRVEADQVYIRSGSSTAVASPDDIVEMAANSTNRAPLISLWLYASESETCAKHLSYEKTNCKMPPSDEISDYGNHVEWPGGIRTQLLNYENQNYYRGGAKYIVQRQLIVPLQFCIENSGTSSATDINVTLRFTANTEQLKLLLKDDLEHAPTRSTLDLMRGRLFGSPPLFLSIKKSALGWSAQFSIKKVLPRQRLIFNEKLYLLTTATTEVSIHADIFADELADKLNDEVSVSIRVEELEVPLDKLYAYLDR